MNQFKQKPLPISRIRIGTPIGGLIVSARSGAVVSISLEKDSAESIADFCAEEPVLNLAAKQLREYFAGNRRNFTFEMKPEGTPFQQNVWNALLKIPYGETKSYGQIAQEVGSPKAFRAVGMACNRNPIMIAVPCHRVVGADGSLTGYALGTDLKQTLLAMERNP